MKLDLNLWNILFTLATAVVTAVFSLAKGRQINQQVLIDNADRFERLWRGEAEVNVTLRDRIKQGEQDIKAIDERYNRLMRRYVEIEDRQRRLIEFCERRGFELPPLNGD